MATISDDLSSVELAIVEVTNKESDRSHILFIYSVFNTGLPNTS
jgi:hypothetical protein